MNWAGFVVALGIDHTLAPSILRVLSGDLRWKGKAD